MIICNRKISFSFKLNMRIILPFLFLAAFLPAAGQTCFEGCEAELKKEGFAFDAAHRIVKALVGCTAPSFDLLTISGSRLNKSDLKGKIIVLNFWYTACAPCVAEMPALNKLAKEYSDMEVEFVALAQDDSRAIKSFLEKHDFAYQIVPSAKTLNGSFCLINGWPMNMVIDQEGIVRFISTGGYADDRAVSETYASLKPVIDNLLKTK